MANFLYTNNAFSTLASGITAVATSITLAAGEGARFPNPGADEQFALTLTDGTNIEIVYCTSRATDVLTVVRAQEGTTGYAFLAGDSAQLRITAAALEQFNTPPGIVSTADADTLWLDAGENVGLGNIPDIGWTAGSNAFQWENGGAIMDQSGSAFSLMGNAYLGPGGWRRLQTGPYWAAHNG